MSEVQTVITKSFEETKKFGEEFAKTLQPGSTVCLYGDFGAGKTTFTQGLAKGLGIKERIISPTFVIIREHKFKTNRHSGKRSASRIRILDKPE